MSAENFMLTKASRTPAHAGRSANELQPTLTDPGRLWRSRAGWHKSPPVLYTHQLKPKSCKTPTHIPTSYVVLPPSISIRTVYVTDGVVATNYTLRSIIDIASATTELKSEHHANAKIPGWRSLEGFTITRVHQNTQSRIVHCKLWIIGLIDIILVFVEFFVQTFVPCRFDFYRPKKWSSNETCF